LNNSSPQPILRVDQAVVRYGDTVAVDQVSIDVEGEHIVALLGPSGCGKTSLLRCVAGLEPLDSGTVQIAGRQVAGEGTWVPPQRRQVGMVFQQGALFPHMTVRRNVAYGLHREVDVEGRANEFLKLVGLGKLAERFPDQLSGGQQRLVALARALAPQPKLLLLDEPFTGLDAKLRDQLRETVLSILRRTRSTAVLVTHDQDEALSLADRVAVMAAGRILQQAGPRALYQRPAGIEVATFLGGGQLIDCMVRDKRVSCELGDLETDAPDGAARLLLRPEDLRPLRTGEGGGVEARIEGLRFLGHDSICRLELPAGTRVEMRLLGAAVEEGETRLRVRLRRRLFRLFTQASAGDHTAEATD